MRPRPDREGRPTPPTPGQLATAILGRLARPENRHLLEHPPELPLPARLVRDALTGPLCDHVDRSALSDDLLIKWGREIATGARPHGVARACAARLQMPHHAKGLTRSGLPLKDDEIDWRHEGFNPSAAPPTDPEAQAQPKSGRYTLGSRI